MDAETDQKHYNRIALGGLAISGVGAIVAAAFIVTTWISTGEFPYWVFNSHGQLP